MSQASLAEPVDRSFTYQGQLEVSGGVAEGTYDFEFRLFDAESDGAELSPAREVDDLAVSNGLFSIELAFESAFDQQGWLEIAVRDGTDTGSYTTLLPRQKITSAPYASHALNAEMVSVNAIDSDALQDGAVSSSKIAQNAVDASHVNSSEVQLRVALGCKAGTFVTAINQDGSVNCRDGGAGSYTDADAIAAMGDKSDSNPLHHDRYTDADVLATVLASDGPDSDLDADLLDGRHASDFLSANGGQGVGDYAIAGELTVDELTVNGAATAFGLKIDGGDLVFADGTVQDTAAGIAVRTAIDAVPVTIDQPGSYYFAGNMTHIDTQTDAITVSAENVTLDLMGFTLTGPDNGGGDGISGQASATGLVVRNGNIVQFGNNGLSSLGDGTRAVGLTVRENGNNGVALGGTGNEIRGCTALSNGNNGLVTGGNSLLAFSSAYLNGNNGIVSSSSLLTHVVANENQGDGILAGSFSRIANSVANDNSDIGITLGDGSAVVDSVISRNRSWGIRGFRHNHIEGNNLIFNNLDNTTETGGLRVGSDSRAIGNTLSLNLANGIVVDGAGNMIDSNHVAKSTIGFNFASGGSAYRINTATGSTTGFGGTELGATTDLGGNVSF